MNEHSSLRQQWPPGSDLLTLSFYAAFARVSSTLDRVLYVIKIIEKSD